jgi:uncharacterized membrane protein/protein-disulfide isomerase
MENHPVAANSIPSSPLRRPWLAWVRLWLVVAILGAAYLAWVSLHDGPVAGCGAGSGCNKVLQSRWAYWLGIPVSIPALVVYVALLAASFLLGRKQTSGDEERGVWTITIALATVVAGAALWFVGLQMFVIEAFCKFCLATHCCGFAAALLLLKHIPATDDTSLSLWSSNPQRYGVPRRTLPLLFVLGLLGVLTLASGQLLVQKERNLVRRLPAKGHPTQSSAAATNAQPNSLAAAGQGTNALVSPDAHLIAPRLLSVYDGAFLFRLDDVPLLGSPDASNVVVNLYDYNCTHCRELHPLLVGVARAFSNRLAVVSLPMPMASNCNPFIPQGFPTFSNSCDFARISLAVWKADPQLYPQFDEWLFAAAKPVSVGEAQAEAARLVGADALRAALAQPWVDQQIVTACQLHHRNWQATGGPSMPQLVIGEAVSVGPLNGPRHFLLLLDKYLGLRLQP